MHVHCNVGRLTTSLGTAHLLSSNPLTTTRELPKDHCDTALLSTTTPRHSVSELCQNARKWKALVPCKMDAAVVQLSAQLTQAIALVELQRATVEESILRLFGEAQQLNQVSDALCEAATTQGTVLIHLQQLLQSSNAPSDIIQSLAPAALGIAAASGALAAPPPPPSESGPTWSVGEAGVPGQGDTVWHDGQQCTVQYVNSKGLLDLRNQGGAVFYGVAKVHLAPPPGLSVLMLGCPGL